MRSKRLNQRVMFERMTGTVLAAMRAWRVAAMAVTVASLLAAGCNSGELGTSKYANLPARFSCDNVISMTPLYSAVNNPGVWCTVRTDRTGKRYQFDGGGQTSYWNITASQSDKAHQWVAGLIVGLPSIPEPGALQSVVTCYDLVCPTCYRKPVDRQLEVNSFGQASCGLCKCKYDLNNQGAIISGDSAAEKKLFRYRVTYMAATNALLVSN